MPIPQSTVNTLLGFGIPGELYNNSPVRSDSYILNSALASYNIIGATAYSVTSQGVVAAGNTGGTAVFAGYLANPKVYALYGTSGAPLAPTLTLPNAVNAELVTMGDLIVTLPAAAAIGDLVVYDNTTGALSTITPSTALPVGKSSGYAVVSHFTVPAAGLAVITITATPKIPALA